MKTKIVIGCVIFVCLLLVIPAISAAEFNADTEKKLSSNSPYVERKSLTNFLTGKHIGTSEWFPFMLLWMVWCLISYKINGPLYI